ncbi:interleukin-17 receptor C isoform X2 [Lissotriton helveticus]
MQTTLLIQTLLTLLLVEGSCTLEMLESDSVVRCTQGLLCEKMSTGGPYMPEVRSPAHGHRVVPSNLRSETILHCPPNKTKCHTCVRVEVDVSVQYLPGSQYMRTSLFLARLYFYEQQCVEVDVMVPWSSAQESPDLQVKGTVIFECFEAPPKSSVTIKAYTAPGDSEVLSHTHVVPGCELEILRQKTRTCEVPTPILSFQNDDFLIHINGSKNRTYSLRLEHNDRGEVLNRSHGLSGDINYTISHSDIVPCLCILAWLEDIPDPIRVKSCPFKKMPEYQENTWRKSNLTLKPQSDRLAWKFTALCNVSAEVSLCWKPSRESTCHAIPDSRKNFSVYILVNQEFQGVTPHPSLCVQVRGDNRTINTTCPYEDVTVPPVWSNTLLMVVEHFPSNLSLCALEEGDCVPLSKSASLNIPEHLEQQLLQDATVLNKCVKVWSPNKNLTGAVLLCSLEEYVRQHWPLVWVASLMTTCSILLLLVLKKKELKDCVHSLKKDCSSKGLFQNRKILLLYSPDHDSFKILIETLATDLKDLHLSVVVDLWHRGDLDNLGPMQWFHRQRLKVIEEGGVIVLLFSKRALTICDEWFQSKPRAPGRVSWEDPHSTFSTALNCVLPDFLEGRSSGRYVVACFEDLLNRKDIPEIFQRVPVFTLPSQVTDFLVTLSNRGPTLPKKSLLKGESQKMSSRLQHAINRCRTEESELPSKCHWADVSSETSLSDYSRDSLELHHLL